MKFLVDEALSWRVAEALSDAGHDAVHVRDVGLASARDKTILECAVETDRIVVTQDTDFGSLLAARKARSPSIVLFRVSDGRPATQAGLLLANLTSVEADLKEGAIVVISDASIRIRDLRRM
ncbi:MAG: DUF5615 family PIN-like protein [Dehalococcoidia bacterium]